MRLGLNVTSLDPRASVLTALPGSAEAVPETTHPQGSPGRTESELFYLRALWRLQQAYVVHQGDEGANMEYLASIHAMDLTLRRRLRIIDALQPYIHGRVLEWGCHNGLDSCVYRLRFGESLELHGCDVVPPTAYRPYHAFSGQIYRQLDHPHALPYVASTFDVVTSNGVLEHVPDDLASIKEVHRVLRPGGFFLVTCLPNAWSYTEAVQRWRGAPAHDRLYTLSSARSMLQQSGFKVLATRYLFVIPTMLQGFPEAWRRTYQSFQGTLLPINAAFEQIWPFNRFASNLMLVARKVGES